jgi:hypothetical protein
MTVTHTDATVPAMLLAVDDTILDADGGPVFMVDAVVPQTVGHTVTVHLTRLSDFALTYITYPTLTHPVRIRRHV